MEGMENNHNNNATLVIDFEHNDTKKIDALFHHIEHALEDFSTAKRPLHIAVVAYGDGILPFTSHYGKQQHINALQKRDVTFYVCQNAMNALTVTKAQLLTHVHIAPSGVGKITQLQFEGAAYLKA